MSVELAWWPTIRTLTCLQWYTADWDYALTTVYFFCAAIGLAAVLRWGSWFSHRKSGFVRSSCRRSSR